MTARLSIAIALAAGLVAAPKMTVGGCYVTHNVGGRRGGSADYLAYLQGLAGVETTVDTRGAGMSISYRRR